MNLFDENGDKFLEYSEVKQMLAVSSGKASDRDIQNFMFTIDTNKDGKLYKSELIAIV